MKGRGKHSTLLSTHNARGCARSVHDNTHVFVGSQQTSGGKLAPLDHVGQRAKGESSQNIDYSAERICDFCGKIGIKWYDATYREVFCDDCNTRVHSKGRRKRNVVFPIEICSNCCICLATKRCDPCGNEPFCDKCFFDQHGQKNIPENDTTIIDMKISMLENHPYRQIFPHCCICGDYVGTVRCTPGNAMLCRNCSQRSDIERLIWGQDYSVVVSGSQYYMEDIELIPIKAKNYLDKMAKIQYNEMIQHVKKNKARRRAAILEIQKWYRSRRAVFCIKTFVNTCAFEKCRHRSIIYSLRKWKGRNWLYRLQVRNRLRDRFTQKF